MKDRFGRNRGACSQSGCDCGDYTLPPSGHACDYCGCLPTKHINLDTASQPPNPHVAPSAPPLSPAPTTATTAVSPYFLPPEIQASQGWVPDGQSEHLELSTSGATSNAFQFVSTQFYNFMNADAAKRFVVSKIVAIRNNYSARLFLEEMNKLSSVTVSVASKSTAHTVLLPGIAQLQIAEENGVKVWPPSMIAINSLL